MTCGLDLRVMVQALCRRACSPGSRFVRLFHVIGGRAVSSAVDQTGAGTGGPSAWSKMVCHAWCQFHAVGRCKVRRRADDATLAVHSARSRAIHVTHRWSRAMSGSVFDLMRRSLCPGNCRYTRVRDDRSLRKAMNDIDAVVAELRALDTSMWHEEGTDPDLIAGLVHYRAERWEQAQPDLLKAAGRGNLTACFKLANCVSHAVDDDTALLLWQIASDHGHSGARNNVATTMLDQGRRPEALEHFRAAAEAGEVNAMFNLAILLEEEDAEGSRMWLRRAIDAGHPGAHAVLGPMLIQDGEDEQGWEVLEEGAALGNLRACCAAGYLLFLQDRYVEAEIWFSRAFLMTDAVNGQDEVPRLWGMMGCTLAVLNRPQDAIPYLERAMDLGETYVETVLAEARSLVSLQSSVSATLTKASLMNRQSMSSNSLPSGESRSAQELPSKVDECRFCSQCGTPVDPVGKYCVECGSRLA